MHGCSTRTHGRKGAAPVCRRRRPSCPTRVRTGESQRRHAGRGQADVRVGRVGRTRGLAGAASGRPVVRGGIGRPGSAECAFRSPDRCRETSDGIPTVGDRLDTLEFARFLLENGADPNLRQTRRFNNRERNNLNRVGATPYLLAAKHADAPLMQLLVDRGPTPAWPPRADQRGGVRRCAARLGSVAACGRSTTGDTGYTVLHGKCCGRETRRQSSWSTAGPTRWRRTCEGWMPPARIADGVHLHRHRQAHAGHTGELAGTGSCGTADPAMSPEHG